MSKDGAAEKRTQILPTSSLESNTIASYSPADSMLTPPQIGVKIGNSMSNVVGGIKGVGFYIDQIGFGESSTGLTKNMDLRPLGINYFIDTGSQCSNGANAWYYMKGIPEGDALGKNVKKAMREMGLPGLRGLAPGMLEDAKHALDPAPLMDALLGSGYPECELVEKQVGDLYGRTENSEGQSWIADPATIIRKNGLAYQKRWVKKEGARGRLSRDEWLDTTKTQNRDGSNIKQAVSPFENYVTYPSTIIVIGALCLVAYGIMKK
jgi:hypothetical protein